MAAVAAAAAAALANYRAIYAAADATADADADAQILPRTHSICETAPFCRSHLGVNRLRNPNLLFGRYELFKTLGKGACGMVVAAIDHDNHGQIVAIKIQKMDGCSQELWDEVKMEASVGIKIPTHPDICKTIGSFQIDNTFYIVMEIVEGISFKAYMHANPLTSANLPTFAMILRKMASAIAHLHKHGFLHRDIKPDNFVICEEPGGNVKVKLADFGFSSTKEQIDQTTKGTPIFLAPEVAKAIDIDCTCDVWAFGILILLLLTGKKLPSYLEGVTCPEIAYRIIGRLSKNPFPAKLTENENPMFVSIADIARRCLEIDKSKRPSAAEIAICLQIILNQ